MQLFGLHLTKECLLFHPNYLIMGVMINWDGPQLSKKYDLRGKLFQRGDGCLISDSLHSAISVGLQLVR